MLSQIDTAIDALQPVDLKNSNPELVQLRIDPANIWSCSNLSFFCKKARRESKIKFKYFDLFYLYVLGLKTIEEVNSDIE